jgi:hypothetical protein
MPIVWENGELFIGSFMDIFFEVGFSFFMKGRE